MLEIDTVKCQALFKFSSDMQEHDFPSFSYCLLQLVIHFLVNVFIIHMYCTCAVGGGCHLVSHDFLVMVIPRKCQALFCEIVPLKCQALFYEM